MSLPQMAVTPSGLWGGGSVTWAAIRPGRESRGRSLPVGRSHGDGRAARGSSGVCVAQGSGTRAPPKPLVSHPRAARLRKAVKPQARRAPSGHRAGVLGPFSITEGYGPHAVLASTGTAMAVLSFVAVKLLTKGIAR